MGEERIPSKTLDGDRLQRVMLDTLREIRSTLQNIERLLQDAANAKGSQ